MSLKLILYSDRHVEIVISAVANEYDPNDPSLCRCAQQQCSQQNVFENLALAELEMMKRVVVLVVFAFAMVVVAGLAVVVIIATRTRIVTVIITSKLAIAKK